MVYIKPAAHLRTHCVPLSMSRFSSLRTLPRTCTRATTAIPTLTRGLSTTTPAMSGTYARNPDGSVTHTARRQRLDRPLTADEAGDKYCA